MPILYILRIWVYLSRQSNTRNFAARSPCDCVVQTLQYRWPLNWSTDTASPVSQWTSYQIRKIAGCACARNAGNVFPRRRFQSKPLVSDPGMHHGTCVTHVPWCMSGSLTCGDGESIPGACAPAILRIWQEAHGRQRRLYPPQVARHNRTHRWSYRKKTHNIPFISTKPYQESIISPIKPSISGTSWHQSWLSSIVLLRLDVKQGLRCACEGRLHEIGRRGTFSEVFTCQHIYCLCILNILSFTLFMTNGITGSLLTMHSISYYLYFRLSRIFICADRFYLSSHFSCHHYIIGRFFIYVKHPRIHDLQPKWRQLLVKPCTSVHTYYIYIHIYIYNTYVYIILHFDNHRLCRSFWQWQSLLLPSISYQSHFACEKKRDRTIQATFWYAVHTLST